MSVDVYEPATGYDSSRKEHLVRAVPIVKGDVVKVYTWAGEHPNIFIILDTGHTISLPKSLVPELVKAAG